MLTTSLLTCLLLFQGTSVQSGGALPTGTDPETAVPATPSSTPSSAFHIGLMSSSRFDIYEVDEASLSAKLAIPGIEIEVIRLAGYPMMGRLRTDIPAGTESHTTIRLPDGGNLFRVSLGGGMGLMHLRNDGALGFAFLQPGADVEEWVHVSRDGSVALISTTGVGVGAVYLVDLVDGRPPVNLTSGQPPLPVRGQSLRLAGDVAWFVAGGSLYAVDLAKNYALRRMILNLDPGHTIHPEIAISRQGHHAAVITEAGPSQRSLLHVSKDNVVTRVTSTIADYNTPNYEHPLGPHLHVSPQGGRVAYTTGVTLKELYVAEIARKPMVEHVTREENFQAYIDNVGGLAFPFEGQLCFFGGDTQLSGANPRTTLGAAEMYMALFDSQSPTQIKNVSMTNGQLSVPFGLPGKLRFDAVILDPKINHFLLLGRTKTGNEFLQAFPIPAPSNFSGEFTPIGPPGGSTRSQVSTVVKGISDTEVVPLDRDFVILGHVYGRKEIVAYVVEQVGLAQGVSEVARLPLGHEIEKVLTDPAGTYVAFTTVADLDGQHELHVVGRGHHTYTRLLSGLGHEVGSMTFTAGGKLCAAVGDGGGPYDFFLFDPQNLNLGMPIGTSPSEAFVVER